MEELKNIIPTYRVYIITNIVECSKGQCYSPSSATIKKDVQENFPTNEEWNNVAFRKELKNMVKAGDLNQLRNKYKLSANYKRVQACPKVWANKKVYQDEEDYGNYRR